ncbi:hypothetical protein A0128_19720 [Leptospira tipperaryensis]|uniref:Uncharacterized protein n=1 Tax=Leptospira tipperaryensis TaxID=2564040 RepID=A0A1D7V340_9LEPT|nr:hypothetical protein [Leptospira tipperaryensis]AOP36257.1 hypothetical protein A0128_19720 [Leptospira tipperaryensis]
MKPFIFEVVVKKIMYRFALLIFGFLLSANCLGFWSGLVGSKIDSENQQNQYVDNCNNGAMIRRLENVNRDKYTFRGFMADITISVLAATQSVVSAGVYFVTSFFGTTLVILGHDSGMITELNGVISGSHETKCKGEKEYFYKAYSVNVKESSSIFNDKLLAKCSVVTRSEANARIRKDLTLHISQRITEGEPILFAEELNTELETVNLVQCSYTAISEVGDFNCRCIYNIRIRLKE